MDNWLTHIYRNMSIEMVYTPKYYTAIV